MSRTEILGLVVQEALARSFHGSYMDGEEVQDLCEDLGIIIKVPYDPEVHGPNDYDAEPGDDWFEYSLWFKEIINAKTKT